MRYENNERTNAIRVNGRYPLKIKVNGRPISKMRVSGKGLVYEDSYIKAIPFNTTITDNNELRKGLNKQPPLHGQIEYKYPILASSKLVWQRLPSNPSFKYSITSYTITREWIGGITRRLKKTINPDTIRDNLLNYRKGNENNPEYDFSTYSEPSSIYGGLLTNETYFKDITLSTNFVNNKQLRLINFPYSVLSGDTYVQVNPFYLSNLQINAVNYAINGANKYIRYTIRNSYSKIGFSRNINDIRENTVPYTIRYSIKLYKNIISDIDILNTNLTWYNSNDVSEWFDLIEESNMHIVDIFNTTNDNYTTINLYSSDLSNVNFPLKYRPNINELENNIINIYDYLSSSLGEERDIPLIGGPGVVRNLKTIGPESNQFKISNNSKLINLIDNKKYRFLVIRLEITNNGVDNNPTEYFYFKANIDPNTVVWKREYSHKEYSHQECEERGSNNLTGSGSRCRNIYRNIYKYFQYVNNIKTGNTRPDDQ